MHDAVPDAHWGVYGVIFSLGMFMFLQEQRFARLQICFKQKMIFSLHMDYALAAQDMFVRRHSLSHDVLPSDASCPTAFPDHNLRVSPFFLLPPPPCRHLQMRRTFFIIMIARVLAGCKDVSWLVRMCNGCDKENL